MPLWIVVGIVFLILVAGGLTLALRGRPAAESPPAVSDILGADTVGRRARHDEVERQGEELLARRVELDARRGTLAGYTDIDEEFTRLEQRLRGGEISEEEFEREKIRLFGG